MKRPGFRIVKNLTIALTSCGTKIKDIKAPVTIKISDIFNNFFVSIRSRWFFIENFIFIKLDFRGFITSVRIEKHTNTESVYR